MAAAAAPSAHAVVVHCRGAKADDAARAYVYIGRPSKWGNPFAIGRDGDRDAVIHAYAARLRASPALLAAARAELAGKSLGCWCAPHACHGDVLARVANGGAP
jgi:hypothetical protein